MDDISSFDLNVLGASSLVSDPTNKAGSFPLQNDVGNLEDALSLDMDDQELIDLARQWEKNHSDYYPKIKSRAKNNKAYYAGEEYQSGLASPKRTSSNLIFEAKETFIPQAMGKNPEPVVWSDNTPEGLEASNKLKVMLQYKADTMVLRRKMAVTLRQWDANFIGILKHGYDKKNKDFTTQNRNPENFIWCDPNAYIDETGRYIGEAIGENIETTAEKLIELFPKSAAYITEVVGGKMGTRVTYTEFWTDEYCFSKFKNEILDKHKNEFFNYPKTEKNTPEEDEAGLEETSTPGKNHFARPIMPYSFLSVFTLQKQPHDITSLTEQAIPQQDRIVARDLQITKNLRNGNNAIAVSGRYFDKETARQAATALEDGDPVLVPDQTGNVDVRQALVRLPASPLPSGILEAQEVDKQTLRQIYGTYGITPQKPTSETTARGQILQQDQDTSRIGGGIGESLEQLADNVFNWWVQLMYVFYDEPHYAAAMGAQNALEYVMIVNSNLNRNFVVSVAPNSMRPRDEISEMNQALSLWQQKALDPLTLYQKLNFPDPRAAAQQLMLFLTNPQLYAQQLGAPAVQAPPQPGVGQPVQGQPPPTTGGLPPSSGSLSEVPLKK